MASGTRLLFLLTALIVCPAVSESGFIPMLTETFDTVRKSVTMTLGCTDTVHRPRASPDSTAATPATRSPGMPTAAPAAVTQGMPAATSQGMTAMPASRNLETAQSTEPAAPATPNFGASNFDVVNFGSPEMRTLFQSKVPKFQCPAADPAKEKINGVPVLAMNDGSPCALGCYTSADSFYLSKIMQTRSASCKGSGTAILCYLIRNSKDHQGGFSPLKLKSLNEPRAEAYYSSFGCSGLRQEGTDIWQCGDPNPPKCEKYADASFDASSYYFANATGNTVAIEPVAIPKLQLNKLSDKIAAAFNSPRSGRTSPRTESPRSTGQTVPYYSGIPLAVEPSPVAAMEATPGFMSIPDAVLFFAGSGSIFATFCLFRRKASAAVTQPLLATSDSGAKPRSI